MTYQQNIEKTEQPIFAELYEVAAGSTIYRYTSHSEDLEYGGNTFKATVIERDSFSFDLDFKSVTTTIRVTVQDAFSQYIANTPVEPTNIKIWRAFTEDLTDFVFLFNGTIKRISVSNHIAQVTVESISHILRNKQPSVIFQSNCNHTLFDSGCKLNDTSYKVNAVITISGSTLVSSTFGGYSNGYFTGGYVIFGTDIRLITNHSGNTITIQIPFDARLKNGNTVSAYPGCNGSRSTCINKFGNHVNFLGMVIPSKNPVYWGIK